MALGKTYPTVVLCPSTRGSQEQMGTKDILVSMYN